MKRIRVGATLLVPVVSMFLALPLVAQVKKQETNNGAKRTRGDLCTLIMQFDKNGDGKMSDQERTTVDQFMQGQIGSPVPPGLPILALTVRQFDKNGDGKLDDKEDVVLNKFMTTERKLPVKSSTTILGSFIRQFDVDRDGKLNEKEHAMLDKFMAERVEVKKAKANSTN